MAQCVIDPQSSLVLLLARRVNSAIRERVGLDLRERRPRRPVVTHCYIDPSTRRLSHMSHDLQLPMPPAAADANPTAST